MSDAYKLFTDKPTLFECKLELDGASLKETIARLVVEAPDRTLLFTGTVTHEGVCTIPIGRLRGMLDENTTGKLRLEVIAEDTYFQPWETNFHVTPSRKLTVEMAPAVEISSGPRLRVEVKNRPTAPLKELQQKHALKNDPKKAVIREIVEGLTVQGITASNALKQRTAIKQAIEEHLILSGLEMDPASLVSEIIKSLPKR